MLRFTPHRQPEINNEQQATIMKLLIPNSYLLVTVNDWKEATR